MINGASYTELIDLGSENLHCQQPAPLPTGLETFSAACLTSKIGNPVLCGGFGDDQKTQSNVCKEYELNTNEWKVTNTTLRVARSNPAYAEILNGQYWIVGGAVSL